jgi:5-(carboxyamino)imidazole ribonucleotide mutase
METAADLTGPIEPRVGIIMGSDSDMPVMQAAAEQLTAFGIPYEVTVVSAHRTPMRMVDYAGAGGAAHLPGMVASLTTLPVIGVPVKSSNSIDGWDSVLSILQMPNGIPVATVALNASKNAAILAASILSISDPAIAGNLEKFKTDMEKDVLLKAGKLDKDGWPNGYDQPK